MDEEEFQNLLGSLPDEEAPVGEPSVEEGSATPQKGFVEKVVTEDIPAAGKMLVGGVADTARAIGDIPSVLGRAVELHRQGSTGGVPESLATAVMEKFMEGKSPEEAKALLLKLGGGSSGAALASLIPGLGPLKILAPVVGGVLGTQTAQEISETLGYEPDTPAFSEEKGHLVIQNLLAQVAGQTVNPMMGKVLKKGGNLLKNISEASEFLRDKKRGHAEAIAGAFTVGARVADSPLADRMREGADVFAPVFLKEIKPKAENAISAKTALMEAITERSKMKEGTMNLLSSKAKSLKGADRDAFMFSSGELGLGRKIKEAKALAESGGIGADAAMSKVNILQKIDEEFSKDMPHHELRTQSVPIKKTFAEMQEMLDRTYEELRQLRLFDDSIEMKQGTTPSALAEVATRIEAYEDIANGIKDAMDSKMKSLAEKGKISKASADILGKANHEIHHLMPFVTGFERFIASDRQAVLRDPPRSLVQKSGSIFGRNQSVVGEAIDMVARPLVEPLTERANLRKSIGFAGESLDEIGKASELLSGARDPASAISGFPSLGTQVAGAGMSAAAPVFDAMGNPVASAAMVAGQTPTFSPDDYDGIVNNAPFMSLLEQDPEISDDTKMAFIQSKNGTQFEKNMALGKLKIEARNKGWFPPPEMQGIHSFIKLPKVEYRGNKVVGTITDPSEGALFLDAVNEIPDVAKRTKLKTAFNSNGRYVLEIPSTLKLNAAPVKAPVKAEPEPVDDTIDDKGSTAKISANSGQSSMERVVHDY